MIKTTGLELRSTLTDDWNFELSLVDAPVSLPGPGEILVQVKGAPVNPTDLVMLLGPADLSRATISGAPARPIVTAPCLEAGRERVAARKGHSLRVGIEGSGVVVAAGAGQEDLVGRTVAGMGGAMYSEYALLKADQIIVMPEGATPADAASSFVNPLTALAMIEAVRSEGHSAIVQTAASSNLGGMLSRLCQAEGIPIVNIVRSDAQAQALRDEGAQYVCCSASPSFLDELEVAIRATGATIAFDAIGGGDLVGQILHCMEKALQPTGGKYNMYGGAGFKQAYIYGALDPAPTAFSRTFGMAWSIGGWLLTPVLAKLGPEVEARLKQRVAAEIKTTFKSNYGAELSLAEFLQPDVLIAASRRTSGEKVLLNPSKA